MYYKNYENLAFDIKKNLYKVHGKNFDLVVGIPRSGMIPAYMLGLYLNVNVIDFDGLIENRVLSKGLIRKSKHSIRNAWDANNILLVDDSIVTGKSLQDKLSHLPDQLKRKITTLAIYSHLPMRNDVDVIFEHVPNPRAFEWNIFHRDLLSRSCVDIDGVLCVDPTAEENDDGEKYVEFLLNAKPHILPSYKIHSLVTSRLEKYREQTVFWLNKYGIEYDYLIMIDLPNKEERQRLGLHATHKANYYKHSKLGFFIESDASQALKIMKLTGKPVFCVESNSLYSPDLHHKLTKNSRSFIISLMPSWLIKLTRPAYKTLTGILK